MSVWVQTQGKWYEFKAGAKANSVGAGSPAPFIVVSDQAGENIGYVLLTPGTVVAVGDKPETYPII